VPILLLSLFLIKDLLCLENTLNKNRLLKIGNGEICARVLGPATSRSCSIFLSISFSSLEQSDNTFREITPRHSLALGYRLLFNLNCRYEINEQQEMFLD